MISNPFNLSGPDFLVFYGVLCLIVFAVCWFIPSVFEKRDAHTVRRVADEISNDPVMIAGLRAGRHELLRVAIVSLIERRTLKMVHHNIQCADLDTICQASTPLERAILSKTAALGPAKTLFTDDVVRGEVEAVLRQLQEKGLLIGGKHITMRVIFGVVMAMGLWWVAFEKISLALERGHHNVLFLVLFGLFFPLLLAWPLKRQQSGFGRQVLARLQNLFWGLKQRRQVVSLCSDTGELAYLSGVFGFGSVAGIAAVSLGELNLNPPPRIQSSDSWYGGSGCGGSSSCGGSSCGGGCGGGCGGCGG